MRCSAMVKHLLIVIDPSWSTHKAISHSSQYSTTGVTKAMVCAILSVGWYI